MRALLAVVDLGDDAVHGLGREHRDRAGAVGAGEGGGLRATLRIPLRD